MKLSDRINEEQIEHAASFFYVLKHPVRIEIIQILLETEQMNVTQIREKLNMSQPEASQHLDRLFKVGIIKNSSRGKYKYKSVDMDLLTIIDKFSEEHYLNITKFRYG